MRSVAIVFDTVSGSTGEMGEIIRDELRDEFAIAVVPVAEATTLSGFDAVVLGSPMRFGGFTSRMRRFIERNGAELARKKVACFFSVLYVVRIAEEKWPEPLPYVDPGLALSTIPRKKATGMDRTHSLAYYDRQLRKRTPGIAPVSMAYLKGRLVLRELPLLLRLFMRLVTALTTKEREGEFLDPASVRRWAAELRRALA